MEKYIITMKSGFAWTLTYDLGNYWIDGVQSPFGRTGDIRLTAQRVYDWRQMDSSGYEDDDDVETIEPVTGV